MAFASPRLLENAFRKACKKTSFSHESRKRKFENLFSEKPEFRKISEKQMPRCGEIHEKYQPLYLRK